jgi:hypothetical protein
VWARLHHTNRRGCRLLWISILKFELRGLSLLHCRCFVLAFFRHNQKSIRELFPGTL